MTFLITLVAGVAAFIGAIAIVNVICPGGSKGIETFIYVIGLGLPCYAPACFHHSWTAASLIHVASIGIFFLMWLFQNRLEAFLVGLLWAVLLSTGYPQLTHAREKQKQINALRQQRHSEQAAQSPPLPSSPPSTAPPASKQ